MLNIELNMHSVINCVVHHILSPAFQERYVWLPTSASPLPECIRKNPKFFPFFDGALGAFDSTHIFASASEAEHAAHCNWKGDVTQNMLAACTFQMLFCYLYSGWEGSAADSMIFDAAQNSLYVSHCLM
jgi:hypothetical protein